MALSDLATIQWGAAFYGIANAMEASTNLLLDEDRTNGAQDVSARGQAKADVFDYIERLYNPKRRHSTLGYISPMKFERKAGLL
jgi:putative transposase